MKGDREKCFEAGASDYISKPVDVNRLIAVLKACIYHEIHERHERHEKE